MSTTDGETFDELLTKSSLGTPAAQAVIASCPPELAEEAQRRLNAARQTPAVMLVPNPSTADRGASIALWSGRCLTCQDLGSADPFDTGPRALLEAAQVVAVHWNAVHGPLSPAAAAVLRHLAATPDAEQTEEDIRRATEIGPQPVVHHPGAVQHGRPGHGDRARRNGLVVPDHRRRQGPRAGTAVNVFLTPARKMDAGGLWEGVCSDCAQPDMIDTPVGPAVLMPDPNASTWYRTGPMTASKAAKAVTDHWDAKHGAQRAREMALALYEDRLARGETTPAMDAVFAALQKLQPEEGS